MREIAKFVPSIVILIIILANAANALAAITFTISNPQVTDETIVIDVSLSGLSASSCSQNKCYLQAALKENENSKYFGFTQNNSGDWYQYQSKPGSENIQLTFFNFEPVEGMWSGSLSLKFDPNDSKYKGPGAYYINAWRYSGKSDNPTDDADQTITVELTVPKAVENETVSQNLDLSSEETSKSPTTSTRASISPKLTIKSPISSPKVLSSTTSKNDSKEQVTENSSMQVEPSLFQNESKKEEPTKKVAGILVGSGALLISLSIAGYIYYRRQNSQPIVTKGENPS